MQNQETRNKKVKILIIGESCVDEFVYCDTDRLAPDLPIPILNIRHKKINPGMAMNVRRNLQPYFSKISIQTNSNWKKNKKTRYIDSKTNHHFIRIDNDYNYQKFTKKINFSFYDGIIISDYNKGFLDEEKIFDICSNNPMVFLDTKKILGDWALKAKFIKINTYEFMRSKNQISSNLFKKIIRTAGENGAYYNEKHFPLKNKIMVKDSVGAGDSFLAAFVVKFFECSNVEMSISWANEKASKVVTQRGLGTI